MEYLRRASQHISDHGRGPDDALMHVTKNELRALGQLHPSGELPRNPTTGLPEAGFLDQILPMVAGLGVTALTGGAAAPVLGGLMSGGTLGALASGATSAAMTGDLGKGIMSGLLSYGAGNVLSSLGDTTAQAGASGLTQTGTNTAANAATNAANLSANQIARDAASSLVPPSTVSGSVIPGFAGRDIPGAVQALANYTPTSPSFGDQLSAAANNLSSNPLGTLKNTFVDNALKTTLPLGVGLLGSMEQQGIDVPKEPTSKELQKKYPEQFPEARRVVAAPQGFNPGVDPEWNYFQPMAAGGGVEGYYAKGGIADANPKASVRANVEAEAKMALIDHHPKAKEALRRYADMFGEDALKSLTEQMSSMGGRIRGAGGGLDDLIPGTIEGRKEVRLADGEFVVPADVVSHLGDGSSDHGVRKLTEMMDRIRKEKTGTTKQAGHIKDKKVLPA